jgi:hypothetical protein
LWEAMTAASKHDSFKIGSCLDIEIARYLPEATRAKRAKEMLAAVPRLGRHAAGVVIAMSPLLAPESCRSAVVAEALAAAASTIDRNTNADDLGTPAEYLSEGTMALSPVAREALLRARAAVDEAKHASDLIWLAEYIQCLPDADGAPLAKQVLPAVRAIADKRDIAAALAKLFLELPEADRATVVKEALAAAALAFRQCPAEALSALMHHIPEEERTAVMREHLAPLLSELSEGYRARTLHELSLSVAAIHLLGGDEATIGAFHAIRDVCNWWH